MYHSGMDLDSIRENLTVIAENQRELPKLRSKWVTKAREAGMTWREIARLLDMTEHGIIKAQKLHESK